MTTTVQRPGLLAGLGVVYWLVPFVVSIPFYGRDGQLSVGLLAFKTVMILVGAVVGAALSAYYVPRLSGDYLRGTVLAGIVWFGINVVLDLLVLVGLFAMPVDQWVVEIGARYLVIPIYAAAIGYVAANTRYNRVT